jgi:hypothetical protein
MSGSLSVVFGANSRSALVPGEIIFGWKQAGLKK